MFQMFFYLSHARNHMNKYSNALNNKQKQVFPNHKFSKADHEKKNTVQDEMWKPYRYTLYKYTDKYQHANLLSAGLEVGFQEVVEGPHVLLLTEEQVVRNVLHYLAHQHQASFHTRRRLLVYDPGFQGRHCHRKKHG